MTDTLMNKSLFAGFLQFDVKSGNIESNLSRVEEGLAEIAASNDQISPGIIVLPELWATGFAYAQLPELAEQTPDLLESLKKLAAAHEIIIAGSLPEKNSTKYYNTLFFTGPTGLLGVYRKQKLFSPMEEDNFFSPGDEIASVTTSLGMVAGLVCYDLRFPELLRQQTAFGADLLAISAQWPAARIDHWRILVQARAIENQMYVIAANRCGITGDTLFGGHSMIVGPNGTILCEAGEDEEWGGVSLDHGLLNTVRSHFSTVPSD